MIYGFVQKKQKLIYVIIFTTMVGHRHRFQCYTMPRDAQNSCSLKSQAKVHPTQVTFFRTKAKKTYTGQLQLKILGYSNRD